MLVRLAILLAAWMASRQYSDKEVWPIAEIVEYRTLLKGVHASLYYGTVESDKSSEAARWISTKLIQVLDVRLDELDDLIRLNPLFIGELER